MADKVQQNNVGESHRTTGLANNVHSSDDKDTATPCLCQLVDDWIRQEKFFSAADLNDKLSEYPDCKVFIFKHHLQFYPSYPQDFWFKLPAQERTTKSFTLSQDNYKIVHCTDTPLLTKSFQEGQPQFELLGKHTGTEKFRDSCAKPVVYCSIRPDLSDLTGATEASLRLYSESRYGAIALEVNSDILKKYSEKGAKFYPLGTKTYIAEHSHLILVDRRETSKNGSSSGRSVPCNSGPNADWKLLRFHYQYFQYVAKDVTRLGPIEDIMNHELSTHFGSFNNSNDWTHLELVFYGGMSLKGDEIGQITFEGHHQCSIANRGKCADCPIWFIPRADEGSVEGITARLHLFENDNEAGELIMLSHWLRQSHLPIPLDIGDFALAKFALGLTTKKARAAVGEFAHSGKFRPEDFQKIMAYWEVADSYYFSDWERV